jgi:hypothetical protein
MTLTFVTQRSRRGVIKSLSLTEQRESVSYSSQTEPAPRVFSYDPTDNNNNGRGDPMRYGAYRRWKMPEGGDQKGIASRVQQRPGSKGKPQKKSSDKNAAEKFYDAIKNLSSGPAETGSSSTTGVVEPSGNKKPVQPKKGP